MTTVFDAAGEGSAKACWALMRRAREDKHESASSAAKPSPSQGLAFCRPEKPDTYWSAVLVRTPGAERPVISVVEIGYVRRSEFTSRSDEGRDRAWRATAIIGGPPNLAYTSEAQSASIRSLVEPVAGVVICPLRSKP